MRAAAQIAPDDLTGVRVNVVIDGQFPRADLHHLIKINAGVRRGPLEVDQLKLVRLVGQFVLGLAHRAQHAAGESLTGLDYRAHGLLEARQVLRGERPVDVEVIIETVGHRRTNAELGVGKVLLHGLGQHVSTRVPDDAAPVGTTRRDGLDLGVTLGHPGQVAQVALRVPSDDESVWSSGGNSPLAQGLPSGHPGAHHHAQGGLDRGRRRDHESSLAIQRWRFGCRSYPGAIQELSRDEACTVTTLTVSTAASAIERCPHRLR
jgi:hypothetical protein